MKTIDIKKLQPGTLLYMEPMRDRNIRLIVELQDEDLYIYRDNTGLHLGTTSFIEDRNWCAHVYYTKPHTS